MDPISFPRAGMSVRPRVGVMGVQSGRSDGAAPPDVSFPPTLLSPHIFISICYIHDRVPITRQAGSAFSCCRCRIVLRPLCHLHAPISWSLAPVITAAGDARCLSCPRCRHTISGALTHLARCKIQACDLN